ARTVALSPSLQRMVASVVGPAVVAPVPRQSPPSSRAPMPLAPKVQQLTRPPVQPLRLRQQQSRPLPPKPARAKAREPAPAIRTPRRRFQVAGSVLPPLLVHLSTPPATTGGVSMKRGFS